jgi:hypothetical protein
VRFVLIGDFINAVVSFILIGAAVYFFVVLSDAIVVARRTLDWFPSIKEMIEICNRLMKPRREQRDAITWMMFEYERRQNEANRAKREEEEKTRAKTNRKARVARLESQARAHLGDDAPLPDVIELADSIAPALVYRAGACVYWQDALAQGERWAAQYCRLMALAARVRRAHDEQHQVSWDEALAAAKLISTDEVAARHQIEEVERREPKGWDGQLTEGFWRALERIHKTCGLEVPRSKDPDVSPAAVENLKHLTALAGLSHEREILNRQVQEEWASKHPSLIWPAPAGKDGEEVTEGTNEQQQ